MNIIKNIFKIIEAIDLNFSFIKNNEYIINSEKKIKEE